jgi:hypothetical protein
VVFLSVHPLIESDPSERTPARQQTPTAEAIAWLEDPQPPPSPISLRESIAREFADAMGWPVENVKEALTELTEYDPEKRKWQQFPQTK